MHGGHPRPPATHSESEMLPGWMLPCSSCASLQKNPLPVVPGTSVEGSVRDVTADLKARLEWELVGGCEAVMTAPTTDDPALRTAMPPLDDEVGR
jgi:hypothetical protein